MAVSDRKRIKIPIVPSVMIAAVIAALIFWFVYVGRPAPPSAAMQPPTAAERSYAPDIALSDFRMSAAENMVRQRVVAVRGHITNRGPRTLTSVSVDCSFSDIQGKTIYRERKLIFSSNEKPLKSGETRPFRLAWDYLPDDWNQALPRIAVARIMFTDKANP
ncbi:MAG: hypothetical protein ACRD6B_05275 [Bryobacteraceae bacterium]